MVIHNLYSYGLLLLGTFLLLKSSFANSGIFSKQSILFFIGITIPLSINILGALKIIPMTIYSTPISFTLTLLCFALAIFKFNFLGVAPIALQKIVDRISDSYVVLNEDGNITDYNKTLLTTFKIKDDKLRGKNLIEFLKANKFDINEKRLRETLEKARKTQKIISYEAEITNINKIFMVEISSISSNGTYIGTVVLLKDITQHKQDIQTIKDNQDVLMEKERLASLGQLVGGIAHNLKTPIMSISGAAEGLSDLIKEYDSSIEDPEVTVQDHHEIASDMMEWIEKIKSYTEYMSDVITAVKGQAVAMSEDENMTFTVDELMKRVNILMKHELKNAIIYLNTEIKVDADLSLKGDVNSLVQVINNMISNAIQAYNGKPEQSIDMIVTKEKNKLIISVKDYASGLPKGVKEKLFKEMVTTKGKNGTGLGLYMSYSNIRAHFNGNITVESEEGKGTTFNIILPVQK
jgi:PAS domain S-box-containing protein